MECMIRDMVGIYSIDKHSVRIVIKQYFRMFHNLLPLSFLITDSNDGIVKQGMEAGVAFGKNTPGDLMQIKISSHIHSQKDEGVEKNYAIHTISSTTAKELNEEIVLCEEF